MAGERCLNADLGCFIIADLPHHDDVRVLTEERSKRIGKVKPDLVLHLHLVDSHQVKLHGILRGHEVHIILVEFAEGRVKSGRLSTTRGARYQNHTKWLVKCVLKVYELILVEAELRHVELKIGLVQKPQDDLFTKKSWEHRNSVIHG